jgi:acyl-CoA thioester hydrolase
MTPRYWRTARSVPTAMVEHVRMPRERVMTPLRWSDTDAYGHINNVQFLRLLEEARVVVLADQVGTGDNPPSTALLVARNEIEYLEPLTFRVAPVAVDLWVTRIGAADFDMGYQILDKAPDGTDLLYAQAETMLVAFDPAANRPRRITGAERERLEGWRDEPVKWRRRRSVRTQR